MFMIVAIVRDYKVFNRFLRLSTLSFIAFQIHIFVLDHRPL